MVSLVPVVRLCDMRADLESEVAMVVIESCIVRYKNYAKGCFYLELQIYINLSDASKKYIVTFKPLLYPKVDQLGKKRKLHFLNTGII